MATRTFIYDGTFAGFLTVAAMTAGRWREVSAVERSAPLQEGLFSLSEMVVTDRPIAEAFYGEIGRRISAPARAMMRHAFLSEAEGGEMLLLRYLELGLAVGRRMDDMLADHRVAPVLRLAARVRQEAHRMKGFVRFIEVADGFFYARIEPVNDILPLVGRHFSERLGDRHWMIHDLLRGRGAIYDPLRRTWLIVPVGLHAEPEVTAGERQCVRLWQRYFQRLGVEERRNPKLQQAKVPKKYRRFLPEFE